MIIKSPGPDDLIFHNSRSTEYRSPFGAVSTGTHVDLSVDVFVPGIDVILCYAYGLYTFSYSETQMDSADGMPFRFHAKISMPGDSGLFYYWFCVKPSAVKNDVPASDMHDQLKGSHEKFALAMQSKAYYVFSGEKSDGTGQISSTPARVGALEDRNPKAFQITVFEKNFKTPDWFKGVLLYQIFPDRFYRGTSYVPGQMEAAKNADERIYHEDWYEDVDIHGKPETGYLACDFYGGTLDGIAEKIPYLQDLHIDCLYLNPVFEARSNHRYDTADYLAADPMLGGNEAFDRFSSQMKKNQIAFLLDGVFSHTGADSRYFNKLSRFPENGAYQTAQGKGHSPYASWYSFFPDVSGKLSYDCWWGFADLPNVNENDLSFREFILGKQGVIRNWLAKGAAGFRLDVSDELPDSFLRDIRTAVKSNTGNAGVVLGEVWEDASNKISYGSYRDFLFGSTHDSVMGYTFRDAVLGFLSGATTAQTLHNRLETFRENYPPEAYYCNMNLVSSHDLPRAITVISGAADPHDREQQKRMSLDNGQMQKGLALMRIALALQMGYVGAPSIYYGDEIGAQGYRDPFNRRTYPWDRLTPEQKEQLAFYQEITSLRRKYPVLRTGSFRTLWAKDDVFVFERYLEAGHLDFFGKKCEGAERVIFAVNRSAAQSFSFSLCQDTNQLFIISPMQEEYNVSNKIVIEETLQKEPFYVTMKPYAIQIIAFK